MVPGGDRGMCRSVYEKPLPRQGKDKECHFSFWVIRTLM
jgi:hypothetical protein